MLVELPAYKRLKITRIETQRRRVACSQIMSVDVKRTNVTKWMNLVLRVDLITLHAELSDVIISHPVYTAHKVTCLRIHWQCSSDGSVSCVYIQIRSPSKYRHSTAPFSSVVLLLLLLRNFNSP